VLLTHMLNTALAIMKPPTMREARSPTTESTLNAIR